MRSPESGRFDNEISRTPYVCGALALCLGLLLLGVYWPTSCRSYRRGLPSWLLIGAASVVPLLVGQAYLGGRAPRRSSE